MGGGRCDGTRLVSDGLVCTSWRVDWLDFILDWSVKAAGLLCADWLTGFTLASDGLTFSTLTADCLGGAGVVDHWLPGFTVKFGCERLDGIAAVGDWAVIFVGG